MEVLTVFYLTSFVLAGIIVTAIIALPIINLLCRFKVVRKIDVDFSTLIEDRKQKYGTPIMGGLIVVFSIVLITFFFNLSTETAFAMLVFVAASSLGAIDDLMNIFGGPRKFRNLDRINKLIKVHKNILVRIQYIIFYPWYLYQAFMHLLESNPGNGLRAHEKFTIQAILGLLLGWWYYNVNGGYVWTPFFVFPNIGILIIPVTMIVFLLMINAVNISDGLDGLSAGMLAISFLGFLLIALLNKDLDLTNLIATIIGGLIVYLYFNVAPARVQMGDTGSFGLGALLTVVAFMSGKPLLLGVIGLPFVVEVVSSVGQSIMRRIFGRRILRMAPLHHHLEILGWKEEKVVMRFWIFAIISLIVGLWLSLV